MSKVSKKDFSGHKVTEKDISDYKEFCLKRKRRGEYFVTLVQYLDYLHGRPWPSPFGKSNSSKLPKLQVPSEFDHSKYPSIDSGKYHPTRNSIMDESRLAKESEEIRNKIIEKSKRVAVTYNKGSYQYLTDGTDLTSLGKKNI